jgi:Rrf2 family protein
MLYICNRQIYNKVYKNGRLLKIFFMLTQKAKYGLKALGYLARHYAKGPVLIAAISQQEKIPVKFLQSILLTLKQHQILDSKMGQGGGYFLVDKPKNINLATVLRIINGPIAMLPCVSLNFYERCNDCDETTCNLHPIFEQVRDATLKVFEKKTLKDLV